MNGLELIDIVENKFPSCRFLVVSGNHENESLIEQSDAGRFEFLIKPVKFHFLLARIDFALDKGKDTGDIKQNLSL